MGARAEFWVVASHVSLYSLKLHDSVNIECSRGREVAYRTMDGITARGSRALRMFDQLCLIFLIGARFIVFAKFVLMVCQSIRRCLKRYVAQT